MSGIINFNETFYMKIYRLLLPFLYWSYVCTVFAQSNSDQAKQTSHQKLKHGIDARQFHFLATTATGTRGRTAQLTGAYFVFLEETVLPCHYLFLERQIHPLVTMERLMKMRE